MAAALALKKNKESEESKCPSCGAVLQPEAVLCIQCGYDLRSGKKVNEEAAPKRNPLAIAGLIALILAALGFLAFRIMGGSSTATPPSPSQEPAPAVIATAPTVPVAPVKPEASAPTETNSVMSSTTEPGPEQAATAEAPKESVVNIAEIEQQTRATLEDKLNQTMPVFGIGEAVELRLTNGLVQRGKLSERTEDHLVVQTASNAFKTMDYTLLDRQTRVRADSQFREKYIEFHTRQQVQKRLAATNNAEKVAVP